jgi:hypothetical protein
MQYLRACDLSSAIADSKFRSSFLGQLGDSLCASTFSYSPLTVYRPTTTTYTTDYHTYKGIIVTELIVNLDTSVNTTVIYSATKFVDAVQIHWRPSDFSLFDPAYASLLAYRLRIDYGTAITTNSLPSQTATPGSTPTLPVSTSPPSPSALRRGTIAGISVGASLGLITLVAAAFLIYKWRKRKTSHKDQEEQGGDDTVPGIAELQDPRQQASELEVQDQVNEFSSPRIRVRVARRCVWKERRHD